MSQFLRSIIPPPVARSALIVALRMTSAFVLLSVGDGFVAQAAEVRVIAANSMAPVVRDVGPLFERATGHTLMVRFAAGPVVKREIDGGAPFDAVISITPVIDELIKEDKIIAATRADIAYAGIGVGVRPGAPKPDIGSVDGFKRALLDARSVAYSAEGASGVYFKGLLERLAIAETMAPKLRPMSGERFATAIPSGEADMIVVTMPVITTYGAELVGPVPTELQFYNRFAAAVGGGANDVAAAEAFVRFLTTPVAVTVIKARGMEPGALR